MGGRVGGVDVSEEFKFCENSKKKLGGEGRGIGLGPGGRVKGGCERRIEVFGKIHQKKSGGGGGVGRGGGSGWM